jgi:hypothetical protein
MLARPLPWRGIIAVGGVVGVLALGTLVIKSLPPDFGSRITAQWQRAPAGEPRVATREDRAAEPATAVVPSTAPAVPAAAPEPAPAAPAAATPQPAAPAPPAPAPAAPATAAQPTLAQPAPAQPAPAEPAPALALPPRPDAAAAESARRDLPPRPETPRAAGPTRPSEPSRRGDAARRAESLRAEKGKRTREAEPAPRVAARAEAPARAETAAASGPAASAGRPARATTAQSNAQFAGVPRVEVVSEPSGQRGIDYTARLRDEEGRPLAGADVTLTATMPGGVAFSTRLAARSAGTYVGRLSAIESRPEALRLRVVVEGRMYEIPAIP